MGPENQPVTDPGRQRAHIAEHGTHDRRIERILIPVSLQCPQLAHPRAIAHHLQQTGRLPHRITVYDDPARRRIAVADRLQEHVDIFRIVLTVSQRIIRHHIDEQGPFGRRYDRSAFPLAGRKEQQAYTPENHQQHPGHGLPNPFFL